MNPTSIYIPLFKVEFAEQHANLIETALSTNTISFVQLSQPARDAVRAAIPNSAQRVGGQKPHLPRWAFLVTGKDSLDTRARLLSEQLTIDKLKLALCAVCGAEGRTPMELHGKQSKDGAWVNTGNSLPYEFPSVDHPLFLGDEHTKKVAAFVSSLSPEITIRYRIAVSRFSRANDRYSWEDRVIDLCISLENLISGESSAEMIAREISELIEPNESARTEINSTIRNFYKLRNKIVHGDNEGLAKTLRQHFGNEPSETHFSLIRKIIQRSLYAKTIKSSPNL